MVSKSLQRFLKAFHGLFLLYAAILFQAQGSQDVLSFHFHAVIHQQRERFAHGSLELFQLFFLIQEDRCFCLQVFLVLRFHADRFHAVHRVEA